MTSQVYTCNNPNCNDLTHDHSHKIKNNHAGLLTVDMHCHILNQDVEEIVSDFTEKKTEPAILLESMGQPSVDHNVSMMADLLPKLIDIDVRLNDMNNMGIDIQALSPSPTQYYYWADRDTSAHIVKLQNENIAEICEQHPDRFVGLGNVSLQFPDLAAEQMDYCVKKLGLRGVEISSLVNNKEVSDKEFAPFWKKAEELGIVVFLHPLGTTLGNRLNQHYLANIIGVPLETTIALSHLIFSGVLDRHPNLKICAAHGGGFLGAYQGRSDHGWRVRPECQNIRKAPTDYLKQIFFDTIVHNPNQLQQLINQVGASQVVLGTDYPFDMGDANPLDLIASLKDLSHLEQAEIIGLNAASLLNL